MAEYINREEFIENLKKFAPEHYNALINQLITKQPTADVVEVKHGEWQEERWCDNFQHICSLCHSTVRAHPQSVAYKYCPYCGAKMDGKDGAKSEQYREENCCDCSYFRNISEIKRGINNEYERAIELFKEKYEKAKKLDYVQKPISYALYQTWKIIDKKERKKQGVMKSDKTVSEKR